jgi:hypothetical protein
MVDWSWFIEAAPGMERKHGQVPVKFEKDE